MNRIDHADVFMPLVSPDYAAEETVGLEEYERAVQVAEARGFSDFFAPVFLGEPATDAGRALRG